MPLWKNQDLASNSDIAAVIQVNKGVTTANQSMLYQNTTVSGIITNVAIGQFSADANTVAANPAIPHSGWVLRKEGTGGRAGRVTYEVLVAGRSFQSNVNNAIKMSLFPKYRLQVTSNPISNTFANTTNVSLTVAANSIPAGASLSVTWQRNPNGNIWIDVANTAGAYFNNTSFTLVVNNAIANANTFRAVVSASYANTVYSANATIIKG